MAGVFGIQARWLVIVIAVDTAASSSFIVFS